MPETATAPNKTLDMKGAPCPAPVVQTGKATKEVEANQILDEEADPRKVL